MEINWYPGHMAKTKRLIKEKIALIDIVYEVVDARIPYSSKIRDIDQYIGNKPRILIMTKTDLCDMKETGKWVDYYEAKGFKVVLVDLINNKNVQSIITTTRDVMKPFNEKRLNKGLMERSTRALIVGSPNVGKSTLINRLVGKRATKVGNKPGITKSLDWIRINKEIDLLDSPGILWPKLDNQVIAYNLASLWAIKEEILPIDDVSVYILKKMYQYYPSHLKERYGIDTIDLEDITSTFDLIGKKRGCIIKGGEVDYLKVSRLIIRDLNEGNLGLITFDRIEEGE